MVSVSYVIWSMFILIVLTESTKFLIDNFQGYLSWSLGGAGLGPSWCTCSGGSLRGISAGGLINCNGGRGGKF